MLLVIDRCDELNVFRSVAEAQDDLEAQDVERGEYAVCDDHGEVYRFVRQGRSRNLEPAGVVDPSLPHAYFARTAAKLGVGQEEARRIGAESSDWAGAVAALYDLAFRRAHPGRRRGHEAK